jgi:hypothetical protein
METPVFVDASAKIAGTPVATVDGREMVSERSGSLRADVLGAPWTGT